MPSSTSKESCIVDMPMVQSRSGSYDDSLTKANKYSFLKKLKFENFTFRNQGEPPGV